MSSQEIGEAVRSRHFDLFSEFMEKYLESGPTLLKFLNASEDSEMKVRCIKALGEMSYIESAPALAIVLDDENWLIRSEAAKTLGKIGHLNILTRWLGCSVTRTGG